MANVSPCSMQVEIPGLIFNPFLDRPLNRLSRIFDENGVITTLFGMCVVQSLRAFQMKMITLNSLGAVGKEI
jgi:hypothetical protein